MPHTKRARRLLDGSRPASAATISHCNAPVRDALAALVPAIDRDLRPRSFALPASLRVELVTDVRQENQQVREELAVALGRVGDPRGRELLAGQRRRRMRVLWRRGE